MIDQLKKDQRGNPVPRNRKEVKEKRAVKSFQQKKMIHLKRVNPHQKRAARNQL